MTGDRAECAIPMPGGTLVLAPPSLLGAAGSRATAGERVRRLVGDPQAIARLRAAWRDLGLPGMPERLSERQIIDLLDAAVAAHRLGVAFFPTPIDPEDRLASGPKPTTVPPSAATTTPLKQVRDMSRAERIEAALQRVPSHLSGPLKEAFLGLISPTSIALTVAAFVSLAVAQFFGYGEVADAVLAGIAYGIAGLAGVRALYDMVAATVNAATATSDAEIEAAAARLAGAVVVLGMAFLTIFITRAARKAAKSRATKPAEVEPAESGARPVRRAKTAQPVKSPEIARQKQDGHIAGTPQNLNRLKQGKPTSTFDGSAADADALTQEAWQNGADVPNRPGVRDYDFGKQIGTGPSGGGQSSVRVHQNAAGRIHGHPVGAGSQ